MQVVIVDTETTGFDPATDSLVELAAVYPDSWGRGDHETHTSLVKPTTPIRFDAMAAHHITEEEVANAPDLDMAMDAVFGNEEERNEFLLVAHNAEFDRGFLPQFATHPWICTYRCAMHIWPDAQSHRNQSLRYELGLDVSDMPGKAGGSAHRALYDAWVTFKLYEKMRETHTLDELLHLTTAPLILKKVRFGKHINELWEDVPQSYMRWILTQDFDKDTIHTCNYHLGRL
jgi:exodeoxyribonuclease X